MHLKKEKKKKSFLYLPQELKNKYKHRKDYQQIERRFYALNQKGNNHACKEIKDSERLPIKTSSLQFYSFSGVVV